MPLTIHISLARVERPQNKYKLIFALGITGWETENERDAFLSLVSADVDSFSNEFTLQYQYKNIVMAEEAYPEVLDSLRFWRPAGSTLDMSAVPHTFAEVLEFEQAKSHCFFSHIRTENDSRQRLFESGEWNEDYEDAPIPFQLESKKQEKKPPIDSHKAYTEERIQYHQKNKTANSLFIISRPALNTKQQNQQTTINAEEAENELYKALLYFGGLYGYAGRISSVDNNELQGMTLQLSRDAAIPDAPAGNYYVWPDRNNEASFYLYQKGKQDTLASCRAENEGAHDSEVIANAIIAAVSASEKGTEFEIDYQNISCIADFSNLINQIKNNERIDGETASCYFQQQNALTAHALSKLRVATLAAGISYLGEELEPS